MTQQRALAARARVGVFAPGQRHSDAAACNAECHQPEQARGTSLSRPCRRRLGGYRRPCCGCVGAVDLAERASLLPSYVLLVRRSGNAPFAQRGRGAYVGHRPRRAGALWRAWELVWRARRSPSSSWCAIRFQVGGDTEKRTCHDPPRQSLSLASGTAETAVLVIFAYAGESGVPLHARLSCVVPPQWLVCNCFLRSLCGGRGCWIIRQ